MQIQYIDVAEHAIKLLQAGLPMLVFVMLIVRIGHAYSWLERISSRTDRLVKYLCDIDL